MNDARIIAAAGAITAREGWLGLSPFRVASECGLSRTAVQARFETDVDLAVGVWREFAFEPVGAALEEALDAAGLLGSTGTPSSLAGALSRLSSSSSPLRAAGELLVLAHFVPRLEAAVDETLGSRVRAWLGSGPLVGPRGYLLSAALGLMLTSRRKGAGRRDWGPIAEVLVSSLGAPAPKERLPRERLPHVGRDHAFDTGDSRLDDLLNASLRQIGERGFDGATTRGIARDAGVTEGFLFSRYPSKLDLFLDATRRQQEITYAANEAFMQRLGRTCSAGLAEAVTIREFQRPEAARDRALVLEQWRLGWHVPAVGRAQEKELAAILAAIEESDPERFSHSTVVMHYGHALGLGVSLLPLLDPECWRLPYSQATVPLSEAGL